MAHKNKENLSPYLHPKRVQQREQLKKTAGSTGHRKPLNIPNEDHINDVLFNVFANHGFGDVTHEQRAQLAKYCRLLLEAQRQINITRLLTLRDIAIKHFVDCLIVPRLVKIPFPLLDVGTGAGFPGIPIKILHPNERILLAEGVQKRVEFLKSVRDEMKLPSLDIVGRNIDEEFQLPVQSVITRAVEDSRNTLRNVRSCLAVGGLVIQMKGPKVDPEIELALKEMHPWYELVKDQPYELPHTPHKRRLVIFRKTQVYEHNPDE